MAAGKWQKLESYQTLSILTTAILLLLENRHQTPSPFVVAACMVTAASTAVFLTACCCFSWRCPMSRCIPGLLDPNYGAGQSAGVLRCLSVW